MKNLKLKMQNHSVKCKIHKESFKFLVLFFSFAFLVLFFMGCGYTTSTLRGERIQKIHVATFLNKTYESGLDRLVTDAVIDEFIFNGGVKIVEESRADVELSGVVKDYVLNPLSYNQKNQAEEYRLRISVDISLKEHMTGKIIWESKDLSGEWTFLLSGPLSVSEETAKDKVIEYLAREIVQSALEMW